MSQGKDANSAPWLPLRVAGGAWVVWIGILLSLVVTTANPELVSRPQMLAVPLIITGRFSGRAERVTVSEVLWDQSGQPKIAAGGELVVRELILPAGARLDEELIVPLRPAEGGVYRVQEVPVGLAGALPRPRIYRSTPLARRQTDELLGFRRQFQKATR